MAKFNVGDKVRVKDVCKDHTGLGIMPTMKQRFGTIVTIEKVFNMESSDFFYKGIAYYIEEEKEPDLIQYYWAEDWLEPIETTNK